MVSPNLLINYGKAPSLGQTRNFLLYSFIQAETALGKHTWLNTIFMRPDDRVVV